MTAGNAEEYFDVDGTTIRPKSGVKIYGGAAGIKVTSADGCVTYRAAALDYKSGKPVSVADPGLELDTAFDIGENNTVKVSEGKTVAVEKDGVYIILTDANTGEYVSVENKGDDADGEPILELKTVDDIGLYYIKTVAKGELSDYFTAGKDGTVSLKSDFPVLLGGTTVVNADNAGNYVVYTPETITLSKKLYGDESSGTEITEENVKTFFDFAADGTVTLKSGKNVYTAGGREIAASEIAGYLTYTPPASEEEETEE